jgi:hypothetical protein
MSFELMLLGNWNNVVRPDIKGTRMHTIRNLNLLVLIGALLLLQGCKIDIDDIFPSTQPTIVVQTESPADTPRVEDRPQTSTDHNQSQPPVKTPEHHQSQPPVKTPEQHQAVPQELDETNQSTPTPPVVDTDESVDEKNQTASTGCHGVAIEGWYDVTGTQLADILTEKAVEFRGFSRTLTYSSNEYGDYAMRIQTILELPRRGRYRFLATADDQVSFAIATDTQMAHPILPTLTTSRASSQGDWGTAAKSDYVTLDANTPYYIVVTYKADSTASHFSIGWQKEGSDQVALLPETLLYHPDTQNSTCTSCPTGVTFGGLSTDKLYGNPGAVYSTTPYQPNDKTSYNPQKLTLNATLKGLPFVGCEVAFTPSSNGGGWVYGAKERTGLKGKMNAIWVAGDAGEDGASTHLDIRADNGWSSRIKAEVEGSSNLNTRTDSIHLRYLDVKRYDQFKITATPLTSTETTYYSMINWSGAYTGIQFGNDHDHKVIFSVWDTNGKKASIVDTGTSNKQVGFSGEGTGVSLRLRFPPSRYGHVKGLPDDYMLHVDHDYTLLLKVTHPNDCGKQSDTCTDYTIYFSDVTRGFKNIKVGTLRFPKKVQPWYASSFVEDWRKRNGDTCLNDGRRTVVYSNISYKPEGKSAWKAVRAASFSSVYRPDNNEICVNYAAKISGTDGFMMSSGGENLDYMQTPLIWDKRRTLRLP